MPEFPDPTTQNRLAGDCLKCPALVEGRECISWGNGSLDAALVVVGEAPGYGDPETDRWRGGNWTGLAYTSRHSGRRIRDLLSDAGYGHEDCYFTNAVKCFPAAEDGGESTDGAESESDGRPTNREPTAEERANCRPFLLTEIEQVEPAAVVTTGKHATKSVLAAADRDIDGFLDAVLEPVPCPDLDTTVVPLLHPSYQDVWLSRLDHTHESYVAAIREMLGALTGG
jgi:DNA polymerase